MIGTQGLDFAILSALFMAARKGYLDLLVSSSVLDHCPCGSGFTYRQCCGVYHGGESLPLTAEALMRSRFSAYFLQNAAYLLSTWHHSTRPTRLEFDQEDAVWQKLEIVRCKKGTQHDIDGSVVFKAYYRQHQAQWLLHETSQFIKPDKQWFYLDGQARCSQMAHNAMMQPRNALCLCGSGKKFKHCCGS